MISFANDKPERRSEKLTDHQADVNAVALIGQLIFRIITGCPIERRFVPKFAQIGQCFVDVVVGPQDRAFVVDRVPVRRQVVFARMNGDAAGLQALERVVDEPLAEPDRTEMVKTAGYKRVNWSCH